MISFVDILFLLSLLFILSSLRDDADEDMKDIDIYFLSLNSKIPEILSAALSNYMIVSTLRYNKNPRLSTLSTGERLQYSYVSNIYLKKIRTKPFSSMDSTMMKFTDLKNEILHSLNQPKQLIRLTEELYSSCEKYSKVKELFWKVNSKIEFNQLF